MSISENSPEELKNDLPGTDPDDPKFTPEVLDKTVIAIPLLKDIKSKGAAEVFDVIIDVHWNYEKGRKAARERVKELIEGLKSKSPGHFGEINEVKTEYSQQYVFARLSGFLIQDLVVEDTKIPPVKNTPDAPEGRAPDDKNRMWRSIYRIWPDFKMKALTNRSISTVKADAARSSFSALGAGITWAVIDSGIDRNHPHFDIHKNIHDNFHRDFTANRIQEEKPFQDDNGHSTHVAGIIAGELKKINEDGKVNEIKAVTRHRDQAGNITYEAQELDAISGMAPKCKLVSLKVLNEEAEGMASSLIVAIEYIQEKNGFGRDIKIDGVNMSLGYDFDPEWFACGQSPLCVEVDRLVKSGVVVVVAAGNTGYQFARTAFRNVVATGLPLSINDPGNAELAITVGSTHRDMPHTYGVSYFSSKGPTGDGRLKPDLVAPGEKIISCAAGKKMSDAATHVNGGCNYVEDSGTSMAAPHVSGVIAAFLSIRKEFRGKPEVVKNIFLSTATDLKRDRYFQGHGLVDLMRAIQSL